MHRFATSIVLLTALSGSALAQSTAPPFDSSHPMVGGVGVAPPAKTPTFSASGGTEILRHRDLNGKPCLAVGGFARQHTVNPNLYDHVIVAENNCPLKIVIQICYYKSLDCIPVEIPGREHKQAVLGTMPSEKEFRFEFREKF